MVEKIARISHQNSITNVTDFQ